MSCFETSTFLPDQEIIDPEIILRACDALGWTYQKLRDELRITAVGDHRNLHGEAALRIQGNRIMWNTYYQRDGHSQAAQIQHKYREILFETRIAYAYQSIVEAFTAQGFALVPARNFVPDAHIKHRFDMKGRSKIKTETEPTAKIRFEIDARGNVTTSSDYIPEDIHLKADQAMAQLEQLFGTRRKIKPKAIPARYKNKAFCKNHLTQNLKNKTS